MKSLKRLKWMGISIALLIMLYFIICFYQYQRLPNSFANNGPFPTTYSLKEDNDTIIFNFKRRNDTLAKAEDNYLAMKHNLKKFTNPLVLRANRLLGQVGIGEYQDIDTANFNNNKRLTEIPVTRHYLILNNYTTKITGNPTQERVYYGLNGKFYKKELLLDSTKRMGTWHTRQIQYMPVVTSDESRNKSTQTTAQIYIPISKATHIILTVFYWIILIALLVAILYLIIRNIIKVAYEISQGRAFTETNYRLLLQAGISLLSLTLLNLLTQILFYFSFLHLLDAEWNPDIDWFSFTKYLSISTFVILLAFAFKKGTRMQQEQDLTI